MQRRFLLSLTSLVVAVSLLPAAAPAQSTTPSLTPSLMLANVYRDGTILAE